MDVFLLRPQPLCRPNGVSTSVPRFLLPQSKLGHTLTLCWRQKPGSMRSAQPFAMIWQSVLYMHICPRALLLTLEAWIGNICPGSFGFSQNRTKSIRCVAQNIATGFLFVQGGWTHRRVARPACARDFVRHFLPLRVTGCDGCFIVYDFAFAQDSL